MIPCSNLTLNCNGNSHNPPPLPYEAGAAGGGGGGGGVTPEAAVAEIEMESDEGPVAVDLPDIRNISIINYFNTRYSQIVFVADSHNVLPDDG